MTRFRWRTGTTALALSCMLGCTPPLLKYRTNVPAVQLSVVGQPAASDGRARFREIYCAALASPESGVAHCDTVLARLSDEPPERDDPVPAPPLDPRLHILFIPGAFGECFKDSALPFRGAMARLSALGFHVRLVDVSGRSSSSNNARLIAEAVRTEALDAGEKLALVGYSKGAPDILEFLVRYPQLAARVDAVVSIAGAVNGTPLADVAAGLYAPVSGIDLKICGAGDGGVLDSLSRNARLRWLATHRLPSAIRYFSIGSFARPEETARLMDLTNTMMSRAEPLNDGQTIFYDQLIPGSTLLGYAGGDHWAIVLPLQDQWTYWGANSAGTRYPRDLLFEAIVLYVGEALQ